jgi:hypothetical protein
VDAAQASISRCRIPDAPQNIEESIACIELKSGPSTSTNYINSLTQGLTNGDKWDISFTNLHINKRSQTGKFESSGVINHGINCLFPVMNKNAEQPMQIFFESIRSY